MPAAGHSLLFIVPAWQRVELASICYRQQSGVCQALREAGLGARVLVIADDENLDAASAAGLETHRHPNRLGAKLNAGYTFAAEHGFDYVCPVGSDTWIAPDRWARMPGPETVLCTRNYTCVSPDGTRQGHFRFDWDGGVGSRVFPVPMLKACRYRPLDPWRPRGCDTATLRKIRQHLEPALHYTDLHPFEFVGFQSEVQVTPFERLERTCLVGWQEPFAGLEMFGAELVADVKDYYARRRK